MVPAVGAPNGRADIVQGASQRRRRTARTIEKAKISGVGIAGEAMGSPDGTASLQVARRPAARSRV